LLKYLRAHFKSCSVNLCRLGGGTVNINFIENLYMSNFKALTEVHQQEPDKPDSGLHPQAPVSAWAIAVAPSGCRKSTVADIFLKQSKQNLNTRSSV
jgi:hypothetical protein